MFNKNAYLIPHLSSSPHFDVNGVEILLHHHHHDVFSGHYLAANGPIIGAYAPPATGAVPRKQTVKKDRHSKIYTAQGPRDRRVRLSIGIARKFFDLQEMLGFDKPSKTLDWLLTKSKAAIKDLVQSSKHKASVEMTSSPSECDLISSENGEKRNNGKEKGGKDIANQTKESRAKARARARERTKEKMCIKQLNGARSNGCNGYNEDILHLPNGGADLIQESVNMIKRKTTTKSPSFFGFQQNGAVSRDLSSSYIIPSANSNENWDVCNYTSQSNLYAILDHHKFINSNSNI